MEKMILGFWKEKELEDSRSFLLIITGVSAAIGSFHGSSRQLTVSQSSICFEDRRRPMFFTPHCCSGFGHVRAVYEVNFRFNLMMDDVVVLTARTVTSSTRRNPRHSVCGRVFGGSGGGTASQYSSRLSFQPSTRVPMILKMIHERVLVLSPTQRHVGSQSNVHLAVTRGTRDVEEDTLVGFGLWLAEVPDRFPIW